ncbi:MAG: hypothetical protein ACI936_002656 [Paraglaciecola sp.]|jgi:hypothetical protein
MDNKKMQYDISIIENIACITIEGNLNSLDLMFMFQSKEYKDVINQYKKILIDYTNISSVVLTAEDVFAITMLGKMGLENLGKMTIVTAVNENEHNVMEKVAQSIFSDSQSDIFVTDSKSNAMRILHST